MPDFTKGDTPTPRGWKGGNKKFGINRTLDGHISPDEDTFTEDIHALANVHEPD